MNRGSTPALWREAYLVTDVCFEENEKINGKLPE